MKMPDEIELGYPFQSPPKTPIMKSPVSCCLRGLCLLVSTGDNAYKIILVKVFELSLGTR
jgi:hypothetical protein